MRRDNLDWSASPVKTGIACWYSALSALTLLGLVVGVVVATV